MLDKFIKIRKSIMFSIKTLIISAITFIFVETWVTFYPSALFSKDGNYLVIFSFVFFVILGTVNGVNFTDGLDGLASSVTVLVATFFTVGTDEVKAWTFKKGMKAPQCAGIIHTDFERGFIRAEVIKYDDYITLGGESACRAAGKLGIEGKEYIVQDGDIMHFLFNV